MNWHKLHIAVGLTVLATFLALVSTSVGPPSRSTPAEAAKDGGDGPIVVKFVEGSGMRLRGGELTSADDQPVTGVVNALVRRAGAQVSRVFSRPEAALAADKARGEALSGKPLPDLNLFYQFELPPGQDPDKLVDELNALDIVETAYITPPPAPPPVTPDFEGEQGYLDAAPDGIGSRIAWELPGGRGAGVIIADVEYCWNTSHEDLSKATPDKILLFSGETIDCPTFSNDPDGRQHGTSVIGELIADNNAFGVTGMVSDADVRLSPQKIDGSFNRPNAINRAVAAAALAGPGNIVLLETQTEGAHGGCDASGQTGCVAVEYLDAEFAAIQVGSALGVIVVEAAGNGSEDLDHADYGGKFDRTVRDSGAIIVGAGFPPGYADPARSKLDFSTYGSRVDVQGWGTGIVTTGYGTRYVGSDPNDSNLWYASSFGGTSGASPIVASAAAAIQAVTMARGDSPLSPAEMRDLLVSTGTPQQDSASFPAADNHIGPLPNLAAALTADVRVSKTDTPDPVVAGDELYYTLSVYNDGPNLAPDVTVTDTLPSEVDFVVDSEGLCTEGPPGVVTCEFGNLAVGTGASTTVKVAVHPDVVANAGGPTAILNTAVVSSALADPDESDNTVTEGTIVEELADLRITKVNKPDDEVQAGDAVTYTILIDNYGPSVARNVHLRDLTLSNGSFTITGVTPSQGTCDPPPPPLPWTVPAPGVAMVTCDLGDLDPASPSVSGRATVEVEATAEEAQDINNIADVVSDTPDPDISNNQAQASVSVTAVADLELCKTDVPGGSLCTGTASGAAGPDPVIAGNTLRYELEVVNTGPSTAVNVVVEDVLPAGVSINSVSAAGGDCNAGVPGDPFLPTTCTFGSLLSGESSMIIIEATVLPDTLGLIHNDARVSSDTVDMDNADNLATESTQVNAQADIVVTKSDFPDPVVAGEPLTYEVSITNNGPSLARDMQLTDQLPNGVSLTGTTISNGEGTCVLLEVPPNTLSCQLNDLGPGESVLVYIHVMVDSSVPDGTTLTNSASASSSATDPDSANNTNISEDTDVNAVADLEILKTSDRDLYKPSTTVPYTITVMNHGSSDAVNVVVTDELPDEKVGYYVYDNGGCGPPVGTTLTCSLGTVAAGATVQFQVYFHVRGNQGLVTNTASVASPTTDPDTGNNTSVRTILVQGKDTGKK